MKYLVDIKDTSYAIVEFEADSREQAEEIAYGRYYEGKRIGHKSIKTTQDTYGHLFTEVQKNIADDLNDMRR